MTVRAAVTLRIEGDSYGEISLKAATISVPHSMYQMHTDPEAEPGPIRAVVTIIVEGDSYGEIESKANTIRVPDSVFELTADKSGPAAPSEITLRIDPNRRGMPAEWIKVQRGLGDHEEDSVAFYGTDAQVVIDAIAWLFASGRGRQR